MAMGKMALPTLNAREPFFLLISLSLIWLWGLIRKQASIPVFLALSLLTMDYLFTHYRLVLSFLADSAFVSHRVELTAYSHVDAKEALQRIGPVFKTGSYSSPVASITS